MPSRDSRPRELRICDIKPSSIADWVSRRSEIEIAPSYQREGHLWSTSDKAYLIDSIINGYDIPKFYVADFRKRPSRLNVTRKQYAIIDGRQRFEAIFEFYDGTLRLAADFVLLSDPSCRISGATYDQVRAVHPDLARRFDTYVLTVMGVETADDEIIKEMFVRLNRSKPLTGAEIRNAMAGPAPQTIRTLAAHDFFTSCVRFRTNRGEGKNAVAKLLMFEDADEPRETKKRNLNAFVAGWSAGRHPDDDEPRGQPRLELLARRVADVLDTMTGVFFQKDRLLSSSGTIPVYYWFVRSISTAQLYMVRDFLLDFESTRRDNRQSLQDPSRDVQPDRVLTDYDRYNRSTNDQASHVNRVEILLRRFREYGGRHDAASRHGS